VASDASIHHHHYRAANSQCGARRIFGGAFLPALKREYESSRPNNVVSKTLDGRGFVMLPSQCNDLLCASGDWFCFECITFTAVNGYATTGAFALTT
jgi:hypothetical protein